MASYNELIALIDAFIKRNGVQAITGQILNGVLKAMVDQVGRGYAIMGVATPSTNPGTPDAPESWFTSTPGTYTNFGGLEVADAEFALLSYTPSGEVWTKTTLTEGIQEVSASIDGNVGTPEVTAEYINGGLIFTFSNMKGQTGDAAGFGTVNATVDGNIGTPGVSVNTSGPDTAKNITFAFRNLKGETGVTSVVATVDNTTGSPSCSVSLVGQELHLDFHGLKGAQGDTGSSVDYPFTIVNNLTTDDPTQALSAAMGVELAGQVSQLEAKVNKIVGPFELDLISGKYIAIPEVGQTIGDPVELSAYSYARVPATAGDTVTIQGSGGNAPRLWAFVDATGVVLSRAENAADARTVPVVLTVPQNAAEVIVNLNNGYVKRAIYEAAWNTKKEIAGLDEKIGEKVSVKPGKNLLNPDRCISGYYIKRTDGELDNAMGYYATPLIVASQSGLYCNNGVRGGYAVGAAVYDSNGDFIRETGNGKIYTYQSGDAYVRFSLNSLVDAYVYTGTVEQDYEEFNPAGGYIKDVSWYSLAKSLKGFEYGKNRLNPADLVSGHYIDRNNGQLDTSSQLQATGFIPVSKKGLVCNNAYWGGNAIGGAVYDINKGFLRSTGKIYTYQDGDAFVRFSLLNADVATAQVEEGSVSTEYVPFSAKEIINPNYLPENTSGTANTIGIFLPAKIYAVVGDTLQIFFKQCIQAVEPLRYNVIVVCRKGKQYHRYFEYTPTVSDIGETDFIINVKDDFGNILGTRKCTLSTVAAPSSPATVKNILCIGDSLTANGYWPSEAYRRLVASGGTPQGDELINISFVGSMTKDGAGYLGKSGWRWADYCTEGRPAFRFSVGVGVAANPGAVYSNNGHNYTVIEVSDNQTILCSAASATDLPTASGTLTKVSGGGDSTIVFSSVSPDSQNPFWDYTNQEMTFVPYVNNYCGGQLDAVFVLLGGNGLFSEQMQYVETFADTLHSEYPNCKLYILGMNVPSMELMMPGYGASGENYADTFNVLVTIEKLKESYRAFAEQDGYKTWVSMFDLGCQFDGDYNYPITMKDVNTRNSTEQEPYDNNVLHPSTIGYYQFADAVYRCIVAEFCQS